MGEARARARSENDPSGASALLTISSVTRSFFGVAALRGVDLEIRRGTLTGLIGPNGAGKSTLFNIVSGQFAPDEGKVLALGEDIWSYGGGRLVLHPASNIACMTWDRATRALPCDQPVWVYGSPCEIDLGLGRYRSCE